MAENQSERDILIEVHTDMKHVLARLEHLHKSDIKQWEKMETLGVRLEGNDKSIGFLLKGFWGNVSTLVGGAVWLFIWLIRRGN